MSERSKPSESGIPIDLNDDGFKKYIDERVKSILDAIAELKNDVAGLKSDMAGLKSDMAGLKSDVAGLKVDIQTLDAVQLRRHQELKRELPALVRHVVREELSRERAGQAAD